jgi:hypothetical protein
MSAPSLRGELGLSTDQFYRRVRVLIDAGMISPERGVKNKILPTETDAAVLRQFRAIEQMNQERGLEWCLERLRYELEVAKRSQFETRAAQLEDSLDFAHTEVRQLRLALAKRTRNPLRRLLALVRRAIRRKEDAQSSDR